MESYKYLHELVDINKRRIGIPIDRYFRVITIIGKHRRTIEKCRKTLKRGEINIKIISNKTIQRKHCAIKKSGSKGYSRNISEKAVLIINNKRVQFLQEEITGHNSVVQIGNEYFRYCVTKIKRAKNPIRPVKVD